MKIDDAVNDSDDDDNNDDDDCINTTTTSSSIMTTSPKVAFGLMVTSRWSRSTKLLYAWPDYYSDR